MERVGIMGIFSSLLKLFSNNETSSIPTFKEFLKTSTVHAKPLCEDVDMKTVVKEHLKLIKGVTDETKSLLLENLNDTNLLVDRNFAKIGPIYNRVLSGNKNWYWEEYVYWLNRCKKRQNYPSTYWRIDIQDIDSAKPNEVFDYMSLPKVKKAMVSKDYALPTKNVKKSILVMLDQQPELWQVVKDAFKDLQRRREWYLFVSTLASRLRNYSDYLEWKKQNPKKRFKLKIFNESDAHLIREALKSNPNALLPIIPDGMECWEPVFKNRG